MMCRNGTDAADGVKRVPGRQPTVASNGATTYERSAREYKLPLVITASSNATAFAKTQMGRRGASSNLHVSPISYQ